MTPDYPLYRINPKLDYLAKHGGNYALSLGANDQFRELLTSTMAQWIADHQPDAALHYKVAGVTEFLGILLTMGEPKPARRNPLRDHLETINPNV